VATINNSTGAMTIVVVATTTTTAAKTRVSVSVVVVGAQAGARVPVPVVGDMPGMDMLPMTRAADGGKVEIF